MTFKNIPYCPLDDSFDELVAWLRKQYAHVRVLPDGSIAALQPLLYTTALFTGITRDGFSHRYCFERSVDALLWFVDLKSEDDEPTGYIARR